MWTLHYISATFVFDSSSNVSMYLCMSPLCVSFYCIYEHLLSINACSPSLMHSIRLYFKTFPHLPSSIWLAITLPIWASHPFILQDDGWFLLKLSLITAPLSFLTENTFQNITYESHSHPDLLSNHIKSEFLSSTNHFKLYSTSDAIINQIYMGSSKQCILFWFMSQLDSFKSKCLLISYATIDSH